MTDDDFKRLSQLVSQIAELECGLVEQYPDFQSEHQRECYDEIIDTLDLTRYKVIQNLKKLRIQIVRET